MLVFGDRSPKPPTQRLSFPSRQQSLHNVQQADAAGYWTFGLVLGCPCSSTRTAHVLPQRPIALADVTSYNGRTCGRVTIIGGLRVASAGVA